MTKEELIKQAERIKISAITNPAGALIEAMEFLSTYAGPQNHFFAALKKMSEHLGRDSLWGETAQSVLEAFQGYVQNDLLRSISLEREIQIDTVSDYLGQAELLLNDKKVHPAAPAVIIGASLEEFLRNWLEDQKVNLTSISNTLDSYCQELRKLNLINKQDAKDITAWGGIRNDAAHGHWDNVKDRERIKIMLSGVNLFMRKYSK